MVKKYLSQLMLSHFCCRNEVNTAFSKTCFADQELEFYGTGDCIKVYVIMPSSFLLTSSSAVVMLSVLLTPKDAPVQEILHTIDISYEAEKMYFISSCLVLKFKDLSGGHKNEGVCPQSGVEIFVLNCILVQ